MGAEREEQLLELEALLSVFDENRVKYSEIDGNFKGSLTIEFESLPSPIDISITDNGVIKSIRVTNLPPASLNFELPPEYPSTSSPKFSIECIWMSCQLLEGLFSILKEQCEANAGLPVLYFCCQAIVDTIRERITGDICLDEAPFIKEKKLTPKEALNLASDTSEKAEDHNFEAGCYDCEICFDNKTGKNCVRIQPCGHVYCLECVSGYVAEKTRGGKMVGAISCLGNDCDSPISQTIIKKCIGEEEFERYERLVLDAALFLMEDVVICPRKSCQTSVIISKDNPRLGLCSCGYSFCVLCKRVYHGLNNCHKPFLPPKMSIRSKVDPQYEFTYDRNQIVKIWNSGNEKLREEMAAWYGGYNKLKELVDTIQNEDWIELNSKPCPKCGTAIEKNLGCNKMQCIKCKIKFCWLCDQILRESDPYAHFRTGNCANKLFQGTFEDENQEHEGPAADFIPMVVQDDDDFDVLIVFE